MSGAENERFVQMAEQIEVANAERMGAILELAKIHRVSLREMMQKLGIHGENNA